MEKQFTVLLAATTRRTEDLNAAWHKVIGYAVKKAHSDKEHGLEYVQAALDAAVGGVRKGVASAFRQLNLNISALENHQYRAEGVRNPKNQEAAFERVKSGDIPDVVAMVDRLPKAKKEETREAAEIAEAAIKRMLAALKANNPEAYAVANDRLTRAIVTTVEKIVEKPVEVVAPNSITIGSDVWNCSEVEIAEAVSVVLAMRSGVKMAA